jgi:uncharacterized protein YfcZ (UPF0381/DUF406 family)
MFCILALYRPSGESYRDEIREKVFNLPSKFADGSNPASKIHDNLSLMQEAVDLDIKIAWGRTGKPIVHALSERSNTFARVLRPYVEVGGILDKEDCAVELIRMFADITEACKELQEAGQDVKRAMNIDTKGVETESRATGDQDNPCHFGADCTRKECTFGHSKADNAKKAQKGHGRGKGGAKGDRRGNGKGKGDRPGGKGGDKKRKPGKGEDRTNCIAKGCTAPSLGFRFCTKCHRKGVENNGSITLKDGSNAEVKLSTTVKQAKRIAHLEKKQKRHKVAEADSESDGSESDEDPEPVKRKAKRASVATIMDRLGLPASKRQRDSE